MTGTLWEEVENAVGVRCSLAWGLRGSAVRSAVRLRREDHRRGRTRGQCFMAGSRSQGG